MDRSFLSRPDVVEASRKFVCMRLATYESAAEAKELKRIFVGRSGELENTTFAVLSSDGQRTLVRPGRSPGHAFGRSSDASAMAKRMNEIAAEHSSKRGKRAQTATMLPKLADVRRGINVAACDGLPLVVAIGKDAKSLEGVERALVPIAWDKAFVGRFEYAATSDPKELGPIDGVAKKASVIVVQPDAYGRTAKVLAQVTDATDEKAVRAALDKALELFVRPDKDVGRHIREGRRKGVHWETEIPVTDPGPRGDRPPR